MRISSTAKANVSAEKLIWQQKRQLAILNAIIQTVSSSYNLKETLEAALEIILTVVNSSVGWICLLEEEDTCTAFVGFKGFCLPNNQGKQNPCFTRCVCSRIRQTRETVVLRKLSEGCPLLLIQDGQEKAIIGHVSVPLTTRSRIVGQLNIAFNDPSQADQMDVDLLKTIGPQLAVAIDNARLWEEIQIKERMRSELLKEVVTAQEEERRRISRELHDELGQELTSMLVRLQVLEKGESQENSGQIVQDLKRSVGSLLSTIHDLALELRPASLDDLGLVPALEHYFRDCPSRIGVEVDFEVMGINGSRLPRQMEITLYRVIQESLTNVARHSGVKNASVLLRHDPHAIIAIIEDNGVGFDIKTGQASTGRLGLYGMEERIALVGGKLTIESRSGGGTSVFVEIPLRTDESP